MVTSKSSYFQYIGPAFESHMKSYFAAIVQPRSLAQKRMEEGGGQELIVCKGYLSPPLRNLIAICDALNDDSNSFKFVDCHRPVMLFSYTIFFFVIA